ncbi:hypothetical protein L6452_01080 [Arctium lappa]|uniref:Uncharacterized protein n=1 Tax=Arctium lappa TaxID=4217 RepID=A0ACB9FGB0_ARCLA|nr:hypothetical protein L6452_01080 [Arctium lappa]
MFCDSVFLFVNQHELQGELEDGITRTAEELNLRKTSVIFKGSEGQIDWIAANQSSVDRDCIQAIIFFLEVVLIFTRDGLINIAAAYKLQNLGSFNINILTSRLAGDMVHLSPSIWKLK